jgi:hypothetical protein
MTPKSMHDKLAPMRTAPSVLSYIPMFNTLSWNADPEEINDLRWRS